MTRDNVIDRDAFVTAVAERIGSATAAEAERAIVATLEALSQRMLHIDINVVADRLPKDFSAALRRHCGTEEEFGAHELYARVAQTEDLQLGFGMEHVQVICQLLARQLDTDGLAHLRLRMPDDILALFDFDRADSDSSLRPAAVPAVPEPRRNTLARGRPGSERPLSEGAAISAHTDSIARSDDPHGDTKLASTTGLSMQRRHEDVASGASKTSRSLSERED
jgi:uncharacterized protein (DUF2267 family)